MAMAYADFAEPEVDRNDLRVEYQDEVLILTLNRPEIRNAVTPGMLVVALDEIAKVANDHSARAILLTGMGTAFCAGGNMAGGAFESMRETVGGRMLKGINRWIEALRKVPVPVVTAVNGPAAGVGLGLALSGDLVVCARSAQFLTSFSRIGIAVDGGLSWFLPRIVGRQRAAAMCLLGEDRIGARTALEWGLVHQVIEDNELREEALHLARRLARGPTKSLGIIKRQLDFAATASLEQALIDEARSQGEAFLTEDLLEGVTAFREKRPARFVGK